MTRLVVMSHVLAEARARDRAVCSVRLPFGALERLAGGSCAAETALSLGVHPRQVYRWRHEGLAWERADELAVRIGMHPLNVWGTDWTGLIE